MTQRLPPSVRGKRRRRRRRRRRGEEEDEKREIAWILQYNY